MNSSMEEALSDPHLAEISTLLMLGAVTGRSATVPSNYVSISMFDGLKKEMEEKVQKGLNLHLDQLRKVEEKCNVILVKVPVLESRTEEVAGLKRQLQVEREERGANERKFMECVDKLMEEIVQLTLRIIQAEEGVEEMKRNLEAGMTPPTTPPENKSGSGSESNNEVKEILNNLSKDFQSRFKELAESQASLQEKIDQIKREVETNNFKEQVAPLPMEVVVDPHPQPPSQPPPPPQVNVSVSVGDVIFSEPDWVPEPEPEKSVQIDRESSKPCQPASLISGVSSTSSINNENTLIETRAPTRHCPRILPTRTSTRLRKRTNKEFPTKEIPLTSTTQTVPQERSEPEPVPPNALNNSKDGEEAIKNKSEVNSSSDIDVIHGVASTAGRYLPYLCLCGTEFQSTEDLSTHMGQHDDTEVEEQVVTSGMEGTDGDQMGSPEVPTIVKIESLSVSSLTEEEHGSHPTLPLTCLCGKKFNSQKSRYYHTRYFVAMKHRYACMPCGKPFDNRSRLLSHMAKNHPIAYSQQSQRKERKQSFNKAPTYGQEGLRHAAKEIEPPGPDGKPRFGCTCGRNYARKGVLSTHIRLASSGTDFPCHLCPQRYIKPIGLKKHLMIAHNVTDWNKGKFVCSSCATSCSSMRELRRHRESVHARPNQ